jgi:hypothetical protein
VRRRRVHADIRTPITPPPRRAGILHVTRDTLYIPRQTNAETRWHYNSILFERILSEHIGDNRTTDNRRLTYRRVQTSPPRWSVRAVAWASSRSSRRKRCRRRRRGRYAVTAAATLVSPSGRVVNNNDNNDNSACITPRPNPEIDNNNRCRLSVHNIIYIIIIYYRKIRERVILPIEIIHGQSRRASNKFTEYSPWLQRPQVIIYNERSIA